MSNTEPMPTARIEHDDRARDRRDRESAAQNPYVITSAFRTLQVLQAFAQPPHRFSLAELIERMGLEKNQLYRSLKTLEHAGFLASGDDARFSPTARLRAIAMASAQEGTPSLIEAAAPGLDALMASTGESVNLFARVEDHAVCVDRRDSPEFVRVASFLGLSVPLHAGAVPKAMLAFLAPDARDEILARLGDLPRYTDATELDPEALRAELAAIRSRGWSISDEDYDASARGVGAPIFDAQGEVVAGVSVGGPSFRVDRDRLERFGRAVVATAADISTRLGYPGPYPTSPS